MLRAKGSFAPRPSPPAPPPRRSAAKAAGNERLPPELRSRRGRGKGAPGGLPGPKRLSAHESPPGLQAGSRPARSATQGPPRPPARPVPWPGLAWRQRSLGSRLSSPLPPPPRGAASQKAHVSPAAHRFQQGGGPRRACAWPAPSERLPWGARSTAGDWGGGQARLKRGRRGGLEKSRETVFSPRGKEVAPPPWNEMGWGYPEKEESVSIFIPGFSLPSGASELRTAPPLPVPTSEPRLRPGGHLSDQPSPQSPQGAAYPPKLALCHPT